MNSRMIDLINDDCRQVAKNNIPQLSKLKNECLLVTGGTGFVGTWLAEMVTALNVDHNFNTRIILMSQGANNFRTKAAHLMKNKLLELVERDVRNVTEIPNDVTMIIHAAGNPDNRAHASDPLKVMRVIANGTDTILDAASRLSNLKRFLHISSGLIYGPQPFDLERLGENFINGPDCNSISSVYSESKRFSETLCSAYRSLYKISITIARPFAFIGPYQLLDKPWAVNNFIRDALMGGPIRILGDGKTLRSYMYPNDMTFWLLRILLDGKVGLAYNVGSPEAITLVGLAEKIAANFSPKPKIISSVSAAERQNVSKFIPDVALVQETLGLGITVGLDEAIRRTLVWFKESNLKHS